MLDEDGNRPIIESTGQAVFTNKGSPDRPQHMILQNLVLTGTAQGVDFSGTKDEPHGHLIQLSWLDGVTVATTSRSLFFNSGPNNEEGHGSLWCTGCELVHRPPALHVGMIAVGTIDSIYLADTTFDSVQWRGNTIKIGAQSVGVDNSVDELGDAIKCGVEDREVPCRDGDHTNLLRRPTLAWFEALADMHSPP